MSEPWFWRSTSIAAQAVRATLAPASLLYGAGQSMRIRLARPIDPGAPVICVGNAVVGGAGKTPFCLLLHRLLAAEGIAASFLIRGYRGALRGPVIVTDRHDAAEVGDEALLLAAAGRTWVAKDRAAGALAAAAAGAQLLIMDDGFQNPRIRKTVSFLLASGDEFSSATFPAGPLRERFENAMARADALVFRAGANPPPSKSGIPAFAISSDTLLPIPPQPVVAFCGIARPERFFSALRLKGFALTAEVAYPDHHAFSVDDLQRLRARARDTKAVLVTTEKDFVRLGAADRVNIVTARVSLTVDEPKRLVRFVRERIGV